MSRPVSPLAVIFVTVFLDLLAFGMILPLIPFYALNFGFSEVAGGVLLASYSMGQFLFAPLWGRLSDRIGRRPVLLWSIAASAVSLLGFGLSTSYWMLLATRVFAGIASANISTAQAYVADVTTPENRAKGMGAVGAAIGLGFVLGPGFGGFLGNFGLPVPALVAAGLSALNFLLAFRILEETRTASGPRARPRFARPATPLVAGLVGVAFVAMVAFSAMESTLAFWGKDTHGWTHVETGYALFYVGVILVVVQGGLIHPLTRRFGPRRLLGAGLVGVAVALALIPASTSLPLLLGTLALLAVSQGIVSPTMSSVLSLEADADAQGSALGLLQSMQSLGRVIGPLGGTLLFEGFGRDAPYFTAAVLTTLAALGAMLAARAMGKGKRAEDEEPVAAHAAT